MLKSKKKFKQNNKNKKAFSERDFFFRKKDGRHNIEKIKTLKTLPHDFSDGIKKTKVRVIGIGGGGCSIISEIASQIKKTSFVAANTDYQALKSISRNAIHFQFGQNITRGLGTGMNVEMGEAAAQNEKERIKKLLEGQDFCILVASLGGGTGSGAAPIFAKIARNLGLITLGIFTMPFKFEGEKKMEIAKESLQKIRPNLNGLAVLPNERIFQIIDKTTPLKDALSFINKNLAETLDGLIETIYLPGLINIDFADLKAILQGRGRFVYLNTASVSEAKGGVEAIKKVINSPLYPYTIGGAKGVLFNIAGNKILSLSDISQVSQTISEKISPEAKVIFGICQNKKYRNTIKITLLASGCVAKIFSEKIKKTEKSFKNETVKKLLRKTKNHLPDKSHKIAIKKKTNARQEKKIKPKLKKAKVQLKVKTETLPTEITEAKIPPPQMNERKNETEVGTPLKIRKNALQIKKEAEETEKELLAKEQFWETPPFLRRQQK